MRLGKKLLGGAAAVVVAATAMTALSPVAEAASAPSSAGAVASRTVFVIPAGATLSKTIGGSHIQAVGASTLAATCTLTVYTPFRYYGGPYGGGEEGMANIQCNLSVAQLFVEVGLFKNNVQVTYNSNTSYYNNQVSVTTEYPVSAGYYYTGTQGTVTDGGVSSSLPFKASSTVYLK